MRKMRQNNDYQPGTWKGLKTSDGRSASFTCPNCKQTGALTDHKITNEGEVSPSVVCPNDDCHFHEFIKLEGWI